MLTRRHLLVLGAALAAMFGRVAPSAAADAGAATSFVQAFGDQLLAVVNGNSPPADKGQQLLPLIDRAVDVPAVARFCLGRFAAGATPQQLAEYDRLFHGVLVNNITAKIGEYRGVGFRLTTTSMRGGDAFVGTVVTRPNNAPVNVQWVVSTASGAPKIVDVVAEGTSLRLTQRSDYDAFIARNGNSVASLLDAMRRQVGNAG